MQHFYACVLLSFSIHFNSLRESEAGFYTCEADNGFQTLRSTGFIRVKNPGIFEKIFYSFLNNLRILCGRYSEY